MSDLPIDLEQTWIGNPHNSLIIIPPEFIKIFSLIILTLLPPEYAIKYSQVLSALSPNSSYIIKDSTAIRGFLKYEL